MALIIFDSVRNVSQNKWDMLTAINYRKLLNLPKQPWRAESTSHYGLTLPLNVIYCTVLQSFTCVWGFSNPGRLYNERNKKCLRLSFLRLMWVLEPRQALTPCWYNKFFDDWSTQLSRNSLSASINHEWFSHNFDAFIDSGGDETAVDKNVFMFDWRDNETNHSDRNLHGGTHPRLMCPYVRSLLLWSVLSRRSTNEQCNEIIDKKSYLWSC